MSVPPESIQVGKCYEAQGPRAKQLRRVIRVLPDRRVQYESRGTPSGWRPGVQERRSFALSVEREVSCDWMPKMDNEKQGMR